MPYWVLATDYNNYALVYSCVNILWYNTEYRVVHSWKFSRQKILSGPSQTAINNAMNNVQVLSQQYYVHRDHSDEGCFYFPDAVPGQPVRFPGQCDNNIQAVASFNLNAFSGAWNEIESYPKNEQEGQCVNYEFVPENPTSFEVHYDQVINQLLSATNGSAEQSSTDGSARFNLNLIIDETNDLNIPYWILATDYTDYALAYSCVNFDSNYRDVWTWKLSRTRELSTNAATAINAAMESIQILDQRYFEPNDQSDEACFYYPELGPTDPVVFRGQCDSNITPMLEFDWSSFAGRWFDIESYYDDYEGECTDATFTEEGPYHNLLFTQVIDQELLSSSSQVTTAADGSGRFTITNDESTLDYLVLATDYTSYALIYSCDNLSDNSRRVRSWKLSRTRELPSTTTIDEVVDSIDVLMDRYYNTRDHSDEACFYYPTPVEGQEVLFRGQCDNTIEVVQDFDLEAYLGTWYDIQSYPQRFQHGTCATAHYDAEEGSSIVDVLNTQVVAQQLDSIHGVAEPETDDGSAKFTVRFPIAGTDLITSSPYWVLATDYENYALVYSCVNINDEYRRVTSWQLSRAKYLSDESQTAINDAMNAVPVLRPQFYEESGHTEDDCFFYPDNNGGPVILDGQCPTEEEIEVVTDFNAALFAVTWHEISRFPSELQTGVCANSNFVTTAQNSLTMTQTIINEERLFTASGLAQVSGDGRGILSATLNAGGGATNINLYVLDVDYNDFALIFSCRNIDEESKQVYSWKLSRSRTGLSDAANERIDAIVSSNVDLFEGYYEETDQTDYGCFHYPIFPELPDSIELPGPCNDTIRGKANFDVIAYRGEWYELAKYPNTYQIGYCGRAHYEPSGSIINIENTEVHAATLLSLSGTGQITSTDGSAQLDVTFVIDGVPVEANYYVLETDYSNFALVYSCRNLANGNRRVSSWKLSRSTTFSNEANVIMDGVIRETQGLIEEYFTTSSQSAIDCFYIPPVDENAAPIFRGQCEAITGVPNFNVQLFLGWWHEIERYPLDVNPGNCISSHYRASGSVIEVVDTSVTGVTGHVNTGTVTATNDGRLRRTFNGVDEDIWVLATDYQNYALLYSCEDLPGGYRRVWSAKHSKARELTPQAQGAMAPVIDGNIVLYPQFYLDVDQSSQACFHYPEQTGGQIILPGQCNPEIAVQLNFEADSYTGDWYVIERYPQLHESPSATCTGARYTMDEETEILTVLNWEVVDDVLQVINGTAVVIPSTDGGGRLTVTLPVLDSDGEATEDSVTRDLYILTTDYGGYSLAYSCINVNEFERAVAAWKLSRERTMSAAGTQAINTYMNTAEELHQPYFVEIEHHEECEEPNTSYLIKSSIVVLIICGIWQLLGSNFVVVS